VIVPRGTARSARLVVVTARDAPRPEVLGRVRALCAELPETHETTQFDGSHLAFQAGRKTFVYLALDTVTVKTEPGAATVLLGDGRFERTPYIGQHGWVTLHLDRGPVAWDEVEDLVVTSYRQVALKRMLRALDAATTG
jgi:predicted DNA-binding protein (MmcQ/YjbR family)